LILEDRKCVCIKDLDCFICGSGRVTINNGVECKFEQNWHGYYITPKDKKEEIDIPITLFNGCFKILN